MSSVPTQAVAQALEYVESGAVIGLGSGRAANAFVRALAAQVKKGLRVRGVPTSAPTEALAREVGVPLAAFEEVDEIDVTVDGADEVDPKLDLIKGYGAALVREKIVAAASKRLVILIGAEKLVPVLGRRGKLPVEVVPFGLSFCRRRLAAMGYPAQTRRTDGDLVVSDNGNYILDCAVSSLQAPAEVDAAIRATPGVVGTGLFLGMADTVIIQDGDSIEIRNRGAV